MKLKCRILNLYRKFSLNGNEEAVVEINFNNISALAELEKLKNLDKDLDIEIVLHREKRTLKANAYMWKLVTEIANKLRISKEKVYIEILKNYGQSEIVSVRADIDVKDYFKYYEEIGTGQVNKVNFKHYKVYKGSSEYDTREMSILLNGVVDECKELDISTLEDKEIEKIIKEWKGSN